MLRLDLAQFFLGAQIDGAEPFALAPQPLERRLDVGDLRQGGAGLEGGQFGKAGGLDFQHVVDFAGDVGEAALGALEAFLGAAERLARGARRFER